METEKSESWNWGGQGTTWFGRRALCTPMGKAVRKGEHGPKAKASKVIPNLNPGTRCCGVPSWWFCDALSEQVFRIHQMASSGRAWHHHGLARECLILVKQRIPRDPLFDQAGMRTALPMDHFLFSEDQMDVEQPRCHSCKNAITQSTASVVMGIALKRMSGAWRQMIGAVRRLSADGRSTKGHQQVFRLSFGYRPMLGRITPMFGRQRRLGDRLTVTQRCSDHRIPKIIGRPKKTRHNWPVIIIICRRNRVHIRSTVYQKSPELLAKPVAAGQFGWCYSGVTLIVLAQFMT